MTLEALRTNGIFLFEERIKGLEQKKYGLKKQIFENIKNKTKKLIDKDMNHPKIEVLLNIVKEFDFKNGDSKIIIFSQYRNTVLFIKNFLNKNKFNSMEFIGNNNYYFKKKDKINRMILKDLIERNKRKY
jgi:ERCC4-related helicase